MSRVRGRTYWGDERSHGEEAHVGEPTEPEVARQTAGWRRPLRRLGRLRSRSIAAVALALLVLAAVVPSLDSGTVFFLASVALIAWLSSRGVASLVRHIKEGAVFGAAHQVAVSPEQAASSTC